MKTGLVGIVSESLRDRFVKEYWYWNKNKEWNPLYLEVKQLVEAINAKFTPDEYMIEDCRCLSYSFIILNRKEKFLSNSESLSYILVDFKGDGVYFQDEEDKVLSKYTYEQREEIYQEIMSYVAGFQLQY